MYVTRPFRIKNYEGSQIWTENLQHFASLRHLYCQDSFYGIMFSYPKGVSVTFYIPLKLLR